MESLTWKKQKHIKLENTLQTVTSSLDGLRIVSGLAHAWGSFDSFILTSGSRAWTSFVAALPHDVH